MAWVALVCGALLALTQCTIVTGLGDLVIVAADAGAATPNDASGSGGDASAPTSIPTSTPTSDDGGPTESKDAATDAAMDGAIEPSLPLNVGDGTFETNLGAAFDDKVAQPAADSARTPMKQGLSAPPLLYREFDCVTTLHWMEVYAPADSFFLYDATNYPNGGTGKMTLVGRRADSSFWYEVATKPFGTTSPVVFDASVITNATAYVAYGVRFASDQPSLAGTLQVAEIRMSAECAGPRAQIAWSTTDFSCSGVDCVAASNPGGTLKRNVTCARSTGGTADEAFCQGQKPSATGGSCSLACGYTLQYIGARAFTYANNSGWLHEGSITSRAGPLPSAVEFGTTQAAIQGKPCSILTTNANTYFVGLDCTEPAEAGTLYCAFRCE